MSELVRTLGRLTEADQERAILRMMDQVLRPEWESTLGKHDDPEASTSIRVLQRVQNLLASICPSLAHHVRSDDRGRLCDHERARVAELLERCLRCCESAAVVPSSDAPGVTVPPPRRRAS